MSGTCFEDIYPEPHRVKTVIGGLDTAEGPVWIAAERRLVFSEVGIKRDEAGAPYASNSGRRHSYDLATGETTMITEPTYMANGLALDHEGRLIACEYESKKMTRFEADGSVTTLASEFNGAKFRAPNDVVVAADGAVYFTDSPGDIYRISPDGAAVTHVAGGYVMVNGLTFSPDEKVLYINDSKGLRGDPDFFWSRGTIKAYDVLAGGCLANERLFATLDGEGSGTPDGMKTDVEGNLYCTGPGGIWVFAPSGEHLGVIETGVVHNETDTTNLAWGDDDGKTLYVTTTSSVVCVRTSLPGALCTPRSL